MPTITDFELLKIIYRELGELRTDHGDTVGMLRTELHLFIQESRWHRETILSRIDKLEKRRPIDWTGLLDGKLIAHSAYPFLHRTPPASGIQLMRSTASFSGMADRPSRALMPPFGAGLVTTLFDLA